MSLTGLPEIDNLIILNLDLNDLIEIIGINYYFRNLIEKLLPEIVVNNYIVSEKYHNGSELCYFATDLLVHKELDLLTILITIYNENYESNLMYESDFYELLGHNVLDNYRHNEHLKDYLTDYLMIAPDNYNWDGFIDNDHYLNIDVDIGCDYYYLVLLEELSLLAKVSIIVNNKKLISRVRDRLSFYEEEYMNIIRREDTLQEEVYGLIRNLYIKRFLVI